MTLAARHYWLWRGRAFVLLFALFLAALALDSTIAHAAAPYSRMVKHSSGLAKAVKEMGAYRVMLGVVVLLWVFHPKRWWAGALVLATAGLGGVFEVFLKWGVGRTRPMQGGTLSVMPFSFSPFRGGIAGFFDQANLCFPSGHSTLAFAVATSLSFLLPKWKVLWFCLAMLVGIERVAELAHYPSDVIGGAIAGICAAVIMRNLFERWPAPALPGFEVISVQPADAALLVPKTMAGDEAEPR